MLILTLQGCPWDDEATFEAAGNGHLSTLQVCALFLYHCCNIPLLAAACRMLLPPLLLLLLMSAAQYIVYAQSLCCCCLVSLLWLRAQRPPASWNMSVCLAAAICGHLETLVWPAPPAFFKILPGTGVSAAAPGYCLTFPFCSAAALLSYTYPAVVKGAAATSPLGCFSVPSSSNRRPP
jgi:hypothetical protein